jgi:hypothetical protein
MRRKRSSMRRIAPRQCPPAPPQYARPRLNREFANERVVRMSRRQSSPASNDGFEQTVKLSVDAAVQAMRGNRRPAASQGLFDAIQVMRQAPPGKARRSQLASLGRLCLQARFEDLSLIALTAAAAEFEAARDHESAESLMLDVGSIFTQLLNIDEAVHWNQRALALGLEHEHHSNAASASTNLALCAFQVDDLARAQELASTSLGYLARTDFPHTEAVTRALLTLLADRLDRPAEEAITVARPLFVSLRDVENGERLRAQAAEALESLVGRQLAAHPELDAASWKRTRLPELWGGGT